MARKKKQTPLMRQYHKIKARHPGAVLLFRMGDFYETFEEDAKTVSNVLGITLTKRSNGSASDVPMAGFPHHALDAHMPKLIRAGLRVAVCEQLEDPKQSRKVVKRGVVEVVTPGVTFSDALLTPKRSTYLAAVHFGSGRQHGGTAGLAYLDASTGEFATAEVPVGELAGLLHGVSPAEVLVEKGQRGQLQEAMPQAQYIVTPQEDWAFTYDFAYEVLLRHFQTHSLKGFGVDDLHSGLIAAGAALHYLGETQQGKLPHVRRLKRHEPGRYMALDPQTKRNLELVATMQGEGEGSLVGILDATSTAMGGRLLRQWLLRPLRDVRQIQQRLDAVDALTKARTRRERLREELGQVADLERLAARVATGRAAPRDLGALLLTLRQIPPLKRILDGEDTDALAKLSEQLTLCSGTCDRIAKALVDDPPANLQDGGVIREGYSEELDELRTLMRSGKDWVAKLQKSEAEKTGISSLKVGFNKVFGYYLEVTHTHKEKVPEGWIRKQTLVNSERYITEELKEYEEKILTAEEKAQALERQLFDDLRLAVAEDVGDLQHNARRLALLDVFCALAEVAERHNYVRPDVHEGVELHIEAGRHPVVERMLPPGEPFIPNDVRLDGESEQILLVTGPNMAGKSVVLRQTGLIVLMAQIGAFVPADRARVGVVDRIFTRVGAQDHLAAGESTFLVEMNETANILNNATPHSLILLDEVGRGTSTFDGLSIAWALVEYLHEEARVAARTLFATHYHELNELAARFGRIRNYRVQVQEHEGKVIFLRKLVPGGADHSYGIEVAKMAGLPDPVVARAREILAHLEGQPLAATDAPAFEGEPASGDGAAQPEPPTEPTSRRTEPAAVPDFEAERLQMSLFGAADPVAEELKAELQDLDTDRMTPIQALLKLSELKALLRG